MGLTQIKIEFPKEYVFLFKNGTSPSDWNKELLIPSLAELIQKLEEQPKIIRELFTDRLDEVFPKKSGMYTVRHVLARTLMHESMHLNTIKAYKKLQK